ncbi:MAG: tetratricopeptide repeat protein [Elusimicrobia bacterium]|nr:tetratricopeptide repeat protein [Elusimicrobiota bacterium]
MQIRLGDSMSVSGTGSHNPLETSSRSVLLGFLALLGLLAYWPVLRVPFMWDDPQMILSNPHIMGWTWDNLKHTFTHDVFNQGIPYYRPLQTLLNMVDFFLYGIRPWGYHLTNLLIHILNVAVLFLVLGELRFSRDSAFWVAGAFAVHPIIVQELMVVAGRAELLSSFFVLLGVWGWVKGTRSGWVLSFLCLPLAILSKESGAALPFVLAFVAATNFSLKSKWKLLLPHFGLLALYLFLRHHFSGEVAPTTGFLEGLRFCLFQAPKIVFVYIRLLFVPWNLHSHRYQPVPGGEAIVLLCLGVVGLVWGFASPRRRGKTLLCLGWFFLMLLPKIPLLATNSLMLEHWVYLAGIAVYGPFIIWISKTRFPWLAGVPLLFWMGMTQFNIHVRGSDALNYSYSAQFSASPWLRHNWGRDLLLRGYPDKAAALFQEVIQRHPEDIQVRNSLGLAYLAMGDPTRAVGALEEAKRLKPFDPTPLANLAVVYLRIGHFAKALEFNEKALHLDPSFVEALFGKAESLRALDRWPEAIDAYRATILLNPVRCDARNNLAGLLAQSGDLVGAQTEMNKIILINPDYPGVQENLNRLKRLITPSK